MALKITKETDPIQVEHLTLCIYANPGVGKTSLAFTAEAPLLLDFDGGAHRSKNRKDTVRVNSWADVSNITESDLAPYKTIIFDTAGRALDMLSIDIIKENPKLGYSGALSQQGFGQLKSRFIAYKNLVNSFGKDLVLVAHSSEQHKGDDIIERLDVQGSSKNEIYKSADLMGKLSIVSGKRLLNFSPSDTAFGKNPAGFPALDVPDFAINPNFLAGVIANTKAALNRLTEEQKEVQNLLANWHAKMEELSTVDDFNKAIPETQQADERVRDNVKRLLASRAKTKGYEFDANLKQFKEKAKAA